MNSPVFQFQTGAIKSQLMDGRDIHFQNPFQFQTGAIKRYGVLGTSGNAGVRFNSKLVRLKGSANESRMPLSQFQFQTGAIKS